MKTQFFFARSPSLLRAFAGNEVCFEVSYSVRVRVLDGKALRTFIDCAAKCPLKSTES